MTTERRTVSLDEAAKILGISRGHAYAMAKKGELPTIRIGTRWLVPAAKLERLLDGARSTAENA
jgi:excisionase family DNA binding protein